MFKFLFRTRRSLIEEVFGGRENSVEESAYRSHFQKYGVPESVAEGVRLVLEEQLDSDLSRLRSSDDFRTNLEFFFYLDSMADVEIVYALEDRFGINISDEEASNAASIEDLVLLVNRKLGD